MKTFMLLIFTFIFTLIPITQSTQAQVSMSDLAENQVCATDTCSVRLTQWKAFSVKWELKVQCWIDGQWKTETYHGDVVYSGSLCDGDISY